MNDLKNAHILNEVGVYRPTLKVMLLFIAGIIYSYEWGTAWFAQNMSKYIFLRIVFYFIDGKLIDAIFKYMYLWTIELKLPLAQIDIILYNASIDNIIGL